MHSHIRGFVSDRSKPGPESALSTLCYENLRCIEQMGSNTGHHTKDKSPGTVAWLAVTD